MGSAAITSFTDAAGVVTQAQFYDFEIHHNFEVEFGKFYDFEFVCGVQGRDAGAGLRRGDFQRLSDGA